MHYPGISKGVSVGENLLKTLCLSYLASTFSEDFLAIRPKLAMSSFMETDPVDIWIAETGYAMEVTMFIPKFEKYLLKIMKIHAPAYFKYWSNNSDIICFTLKIVIPSDDNLRHLIPSTISGLNIEELKAQFKERWWRIESGRVNNFVSYYLDSSLRFTSSNIQIQRYYVTFDLSYRYPDVSYKLFYRYHHAMKSSYSTEAFQCLHILCIWPCLLWGYAASGILGLYTPRDQL